MHSTPGVTSIRTLYDTTTLMALQSESMVGMLLASSYCTGACVLCVQLQAVRARASRLRLPPSQPRSHSPPAHPSGAAAPDHGPTRRPNGLSSCVAPAAAPPLAACSTGAQPPCGDAQRSSTHRGLAEMQEKFGLSCKRGVPGCLGKAPSSEIHLTRKSHINTKVAY